MKKNLYELPIGVFDSGVGGISVLADLVHQLPKEKYVYFGDSHNAPYGTRTREEVESLALGVVDHLLKYRIKALVVACNTATSAVIEKLRRELDIPVIGMEPALKPGVELNRPGKVIVMATAVTLREDKFNRLMESLTHHTNIIKMACPGLVEIIEGEGKDSKEIGNYIKEIFSSCRLEEIGVIVLGCTHYIFIKNIISDVVGADVPIIDGNLGTVRQVRHLLRLNQSLNPGSPKDDRQGETEIRLINSSQDTRMIALSKTLLEDRLKELNWKGTIKYIE